MRMKVQRGIICDSNRSVWMVLGDDCLPIEAIGKYLHYLDSVGRSPNTIQAYAYNLKLFWEFLRDSKLSWQEISLEQLSNFIHWLRNPYTSVLSIKVSSSKRSEKTINHCLTTVCGFYEFQERIGVNLGVNSYGYQLQSNRKYKPFLHHISKEKEVKTRLLKIKEPKTFPGCLTPEQVDNIITACNTLRDKFLIKLLYETGLRIGEALGLRHEDMVTGNACEIRVAPRLDNVNHARAKSGVERTVHVSKELMQWYCAYLIDEYPSDIDCDFVFVVIKAHNQDKMGKPLTYKTVNSLFRRLSRKIGTKINPHLLRHSHASDLIRAGVDMAYVKKRLGHSDIQTTINTYVHLEDEDLKLAYKEYLQNREKQKQ
ncbi:integrase family protein (plasmid) [Calothrix sp. PCC 7716]|nr:integrase family protein [Calothrix sp. PCC 7716]BDA71860.1 integrase family protein [Calothrix sp. PCC 7716]BDA74106.1 integrase family protein [Calothrix sp. PCC 7716]BDA76338.1 integrase family protein [Calothrix sp. PCC 7716]